MKKIKVITIGLVLGFVATTSISFAGMNHGANMTHSQTNLTAEQQQQLDKLQSDLNSKVTEYQNARANDSTTVGTLNKLEAEATELRNQYWTLLDQANAEAGQSVGNGNGIWFTCGYDNCNQQNMNGNHMGMRNGGMMSGGRGNNHQGNMSCDNHMSCGSHMDSDHNMGSSRHNGRMMARCW